MRTKSAKLKNSESIITPRILVQPIPVKKKSHIIRMIMLTGWISRKWDVGIWTGFGWPRIETGGGRLRVQ